MSSSSPPPPETETAEGSLSQGGAGGKENSCGSSEMTKQHATGCARRLPKRIILVRHGQSLGNLDTSAYATTADPRIPLTPLGVEQARDAGRGILKVVSSTSADGDGDAVADPDWKVYFYVSPYERTRATLRRDIHHGRDINHGRLVQSTSSEINLVILSHGITSRVFMMKWFKWTVEQFERLRNLDNCEFRVMQLGPGGEYSLLVHHTKEELEEWGLSPEMIADQQRRASADRPSSAEECSAFTATFFDNWTDPPEEDDNGKKPKQVARVTPINSPLL